MTGSTNKNNTEMKQVKHTIEDVGSVIKGSKKRISWTFSIGQQEERHVVLVWSKNSGKRQVTDGDFVYEDTKKGHFFSHKWNHQGLALHIIASSRTPTNGKMLCDGFCKFELIVNGLPFSRFPHHDGTPLVPLEGPGPYGIFDIIYPQGYDVYFTKEAPLHKKRFRSQTLKKSTPSTQQ